MEQDGTPTAIAMRSIMNAGAHVASGWGIRRTGQGALYLYTCPHARFEGLTVYTNRPAGGSFRGLGAPLGHFALEVLIDQVADALGLDPLDYRLQASCHRCWAARSAHHSADQLLPDEPVEGGHRFRAMACGNASWQGLNASAGGSDASPMARLPGGLRRGMGMALGIYKGGIGREAEAEVRITPAGRVEVHIGNGRRPGFHNGPAQMAAEALEVPVHFVDMVMADTATTPPAPIAGSSTTITCGAAVKLAAEDAKRHLVERCDLPRRVWPYAKRAS